MFVSGQTETVWKIVIVRDDLEEAPIEQLQVTLSDSENSIIINHNRTIISIYDFNTGKSKMCTVIYMKGEHKIFLSNNIYCAKTIIYLT